MTREWRTELGKQDAVKTYGKKAVDVTAVQAPNKFHFPSLYYEADTVVPDAYPVEPFAATELLMLLRERRS